MTNYIIAYYGEPKFKSPTEGTEYMAKWKTWMGGLGDALVNRGHPMGRPKIVSASGVSDSTVANRMAGFSIVKADSMNSALAMVKGCPHLEHGTIDVAEAMEMGMSLAESKPEKDCLPDVAVYAFQQCLLQVNRRIQDLIVRHLQCSSCVLFLTNSAYPQVY